MAKEPKLYRKLPGSGSMAFQFVRLYVGPDHLLQVTSNGFTESYQRFFFQDIQAITYRHTIAWLLWSAAWFALAVIFGAIGLAAGDDALLPMMVITGFWVGILIANLALGPSCACLVKTAVQTQRLPSLKRVRRVKRVMARIRPLITQAQGELAPEELLRALDPATAVYATTAAGATPGAAFTSAPAGTHDGATAPAASTADDLEAPPVVGMADASPASMRPGPAPAPSDDAAGSAPGPAGEPNRG